MRRRTLAEKRAAYRATFFGSLDHPHETGRIVLADLRNFCGITKGALVVSPVDRHTDIPATVYRGALRDVYLRVVAMLGLDAAQQHEEEDPHAGTDSYALTDASTDPDAGPDA